jgi:phenylalanine ammonia-lyase
LSRYDYLSPLVSFLKFLTALDLRALQSEFLVGLRDICHEEFRNSFGSALSSTEYEVVEEHVCKAAIASFEKTSTLDLHERMHKVAASSSTVLVDFLTRSPHPNAVSSLVGIPEFRRRFAERMVELMDNLREAYLFGSRGAAPASGFLNKTRPLYEFVRLTLGEPDLTLSLCNDTYSSGVGIRMHGSENYSRFANGHGIDESTAGEAVSLIHEVSLLYSSVKTMYS